MLIRVAGKLSDGRPFASRVEAGSAVEAVEKVRAGLHKAGQSDDSIRELTARPMQEASDVHFGTAKTAEQLAEAKRLRAEKKAAKNGTAPTAPAIVADIPVDSTVVVDAATQPAVTEVPTVAEALAKTPVAPTSAVKGKR